MKNTYWDRKGRYQAEYEQMVADLMPAEGACDTLAGELIRAATRLTYDFYNNGMCNNTTGAINFLLKQGAVDRATYDAIYPFAAGQPYRGNYGGGALQVAIERAVDMTVAMILHNPQLMTMPNTDDMFNYQDEYWTEEEDDDYDWDEEECWDED
jgi:hypothetical protein